MESHITFWMTQIPAATRRTHVVGRLGLRSTRRRRFIGEHIQNTFRQTLAPIHSPNILIADAPDSIFRTTDNHHTRFGLN